MSDNILADFDINAPIRRGDTISRHHDPIPPGVFTVLKVLPDGTIAYCSRDANGKLVTEVSPAMMLYRNEIWQEQINDRVFVYIRLGDGSWAIAGIRGQNDPPIQQYQPPQMVQVYPHSILWSDGTETLRDSPDAPAEDYWPDGLGSMGSGS